MTTTPSGQRPVRVDTPTARLAFVAGNNSGHQTQFNSPRNAFDVGMPPKKLCIVATSLQELQRLAARNLRIAATAPEEPLVHSQPHLPFHLGSVSSKHSAILGLTD